MIADSDGRGPAPSPGGGPGAVTVTVIRTVADSGWTRQARGRRRLGPLGETLRLCSSQSACGGSRLIYVYSFMRIRHKGFFLIDLISDLLTHQQTFLLGEAALWLYRHN